MARIVFKYVDATNDHHLAKLQLNIWTNLSHLTQIITTLQHTHHKYFLKNCNRKELEYHIRHYLQDLVFNGLKLDDDAHPSGYGTRVSTKEEQDQVNTLLNQYWPETVALDKRKDS